jgi:hypothetical protein
MNDLIETYARAKFGKQAFLESIFGRRVDPKTRAIRDKIEDMIREEQRKRKLAQEAIAYGKHRLAEAPKAGLGGWAADIARSAVPGLSISASTVRDGLVKLAKEPAPESRLGGRLFDAAHLTAAGTGAGLGYASATGKLQDLGTTLRTANKLGTPLTDKLTKSLGKNVGNFGLKHGDILALAASDPSKFDRLLNYVSPRYWLRKATKQIVTPETARNFVAAKLIREGATVEDAFKAVRRLKGSFAPTARNLTAIGAGAKQIKLPGKWGAIAGALALSSPFIAARLAKTRMLRAGGGTAGRASVQKAEELLQGAEQLRKEREALTQQLG